MTSTTPDIYHAMWMSGLVDVRFYTMCGRYPVCGGCLVLWMSGVVNDLFCIRCGGCLVWSMSYFTCGVVDVCVGVGLCGGGRTMGTSRSQIQMWTQKASHYHIFCTRSTRLTWTRWRQSLRRWASWTSSSNCQTNNDYNESRVGALWTQDSVRWWYQKGA